MKKEIESLKVQKTWKVVPKYQVPEGVKIVPTFWAFKFKKFPSGEFYSFMDRF